MAVDLIFVEVLERLDHPVLLSEFAHQVGVVVVGLDRASQT